MIRAGERRSAARARSAAAPAASRRRSDPWRTAFFAVAATAIVAGAAWALLGSSLLVVRSIDITGTHLVSRAAVLRASGIRRGTPLIRVNPAAVAQQVERITQVQSATVSRDWPDAVVIAVRERTPALAVPEQGRYALIDGAGVIVRWAARPPPGMPGLLGSAALRGSPAIRAAVTVLAELPPRVRRAVRTVSAASADAVTLHVRGGITILWGGTDRPRAKAAELVILMKTGASYYDVSDPGTAVTSR